MAQTLYVNPSSGNDGNAGSQGAPFKTIATALSRAASGDRVQLASGTYSTASGDRFPLAVPAGVTVVGNESTKGSGILVQGSGGFSSPTFAVQQVVFVLNNDSQLRGVTVTNPETRGTGAWVESTTPTITNNTFINSKREGVFATGAATVTLEGNVFERNDGNGLSFARNTKGTVRNNTFRNTGYGATVGDSAAPTFQSNVFTSNRTGIVVTGSARPVLRGNTLENSVDNGITIISSGLPDLGTAASPGGNIFRNNAKYDIQNATTNKINAAGNQLTLSKVQGSLDLSGSTSPTPGGSTPPGPTPTPGPIDDVTGTWAEAFIKGLIALDVVGGFEDGSFRPNNSLTRAEFAALINQAFDRPLVKPAMTFSDVPADFWGAGAIAKATRMGFMTGFPDLTFRPNRSLTRAEAFVAIVNGNQITGGSSNLLNSYGDRAQIPSYATGQITTATANRLVVNYPSLNQLRPMAAISRAEMATLIYQVLVLSGNATAISSPYIVQPNTNLPQFSDLTGHWSRAFVEGLADRDLITGFSDGTFRPDANMTRAEYAALITRAFNPAAERPARTFADVPANHWAAGAIQTAYRGGFMSGTADNTFSPNSLLSKAELAASIAGGLNWPDGTDNDLASLLDRQEIPVWARPKAAALVRKQAMVNAPNVRIFAPTKPVTRGDVSATLYQALRSSNGSMPAISSPYIVTT